MIKTTKDRHSRMPPSAVQPRTCLPAGKVPRVPPRRITILGMLLLPIYLSAIEIPLDTLTPVRIGFVDLQKVFDTYPEKSFAEGDLLREIEKRRRDLAKRQAEINTIKGQIEADRAALEKAKTGQAVVVPVNAVPEPEPVKPALVDEPKKSTATIAAEAYPMEDPLAGLPGHSPGEAMTKAGSLPGVQSGPAKRFPLLDQLSSTTEPKTLTADAMGQMELRIAEHQRLLERYMTSFRLFRGNAVADMKQLQAEKTYGVMAKIYAILQELARDEGLTVVLDKAYVLYGEDSVDLSDRLIARLQAITPL